MYTRTSGRSRPVLILLIILAVLIITFYYRGGKDIIDKSQQLVLTVVAPLQKGVAAVISPVRRISDYTLRIHQMAGENRRLKAANVALSRKIGRFKKYEAENRRLRRLAGFAKSAGFKTVAAGVVSRSPTGWQSIITIDAGLARGAAKRSPVVTDKGLVGQVVQASGSAAMVQLIDDRRSGVAVELVRTGATGIVEGAMEGKLRLRFIASDADVKAGDQLVTSGVGGVYPRGLVVGTVAKISQTVYSLEKIIEINPAVNHSKLSEVLVITDGGGE